MQPAIGALVAELGLPAFAQSSDGDVVFERMSRETPQRYRGNADGPESLRLVGGASALVHALVRDLPGERLRLGARVTAMALASEGVELTILARRRRGGDACRATSNRGDAAAPACGDRGVHARG